MYIVNLASEIVLIAPDSFGITIFKIRTFTYSLHPFQEDIYVIDFWNNFSKLEDAIFRYF